MNSILNTFSIGFLFLSVNIMSYIHYSIQLLGAECPVYVRHFLNPTIQEWRYMSNMGTWLIELTFQSKSLSMSKQRDVKDDSRHYVDVIIIDYLMWHFPCIRVRTSFYDYKWLENFWIFSTCYYQTRKRISPNILKGRDWKKFICVPRLRSDSSITCSHRLSTAPH